MITNHHNNDESLVFKLTVVYYGDKDSLVERKYIMYGDNDKELLDHYLEVRHVLGIIQEIKIENDSI